MGALGAARRPRGDHRARGAPAAPPDGPVARRRGPPLGRLRLHLVGHVRAGRRAVRAVRRGRGERRQVVRAAIDVLAGGPDWLPYEELRDRLEGCEIGCVYWYENGAWARAPYPDDLGDDGLDCGMGDFIDRGEVLGELANRLDGTVDGPSADSLLADAEAYRLAPHGLLERLGATNRHDDPLDRQPSSGCWPVPV
ncbi:hypothetical protein ACFQ1I_40550 [Kitasatospora arboriphila]